MSRPSQLSRWAHQHDASPRRYWRDQRGTRPALEAQARDEQLELDLVPREMSVNGGRGAVGKSLSAPRHVRPTLDEIRRAPHLIFD